MRVSETVAMVCVISLLLAFTPGPSFVSAGPKVKVRRLSSLKVVDANGKKVGTVLGLPVPEHIHLAWVAVRMAGHLVPLTVTRQGFRGYRLFFESDDCSGQPYVSLDRLEGSLLQPVAGIASPGNTVYIADPDGGPQTIEARSFAAEGECFSYEPWQEEVVPTISLVDLSEVFTAPFSLR